MLVADASYEKVREDGAIRTQAVLIAIGINREGRRSIPAVELAGRESLSGWKELPVAYRSGHCTEWSCGQRRSCRLRRAIQEALQEAVWRRCYVHFCVMHSTIFRRIKRKNREFRNHSSV